MTSGAGLGGIATDVAGATDPATSGATATDSPTTDTAATDTAVTDEAATDAAAPTGTPAAGWRPESRPRLPSKVRVRWNAPRGQALLLYPEGALALNPTAHSVLELCDGRRTLGEIVSELAGRFDADQGGLADRRDRMQADVIAFLERLRQRGWVADAAAA
jgi:pyrroloquinoline quinone biosynthesis protein D